MLLMRHAASRPHRLIAALIVAALAAWGMVAVSPSASADSDGTLQIEWATPTLLTDVNGNGIPEPGDTVQYTATILSLGPDITAVRLTNSAVNWGPFFAVPTKTFLISLPLVTNAGHYGARGAGPFMDDLTVTYTTPDGDRETTLAAPPAIYAGAPEPSPEPTADPSPEPEPAWSFDASVKAVTFDSKYYVERPLNEVEVNDLIFYTFELTNTGPVALDYLQLSSWADSAAAPDPRVYTNRAAGIAPGASLPTGTVSAFAVNAMNSAPFRPHWVTQEDLDRGYVDLEFEVVAAPAQIDAHLQPELATRHIYQRHMLFEGRPTIDLGAAVSLSQDANLDGIGQQGERVLVDWYFTNTSSEAVEVVSHTYTWSGGSHTENLVPQVVEPGDTGIGSFWTPVEPADMVAGSAEVSFSVSVRGRESGLTGSAAYGPVSVPAGPYVAPEWAWSFHRQTNDVNGDGYLNPGEEHRITVWVENRGDKPLVGLNGEEVTGPDYVGALGLSLPTTVPAQTRIERTVVWTPDESDAGTSWMYGLLMSAEGSGITSRYGSIPVLAYVTPPFTLATDVALVDDANADGLPSIGDTVRVTASVTNDGEYLLTGIDAQSAGLSTVTGFTPDLPATLAAGQTATDTFDYVLTAADFRRGSASYAFTLGADGQEGTTLSPVARLSTIGFAAFEADLDAMPGGGLVVCTAGGDVVSEAYPGLTYSIGVGQCGSDAPFQGGTHLVMMSTPVLLATNSLDFTVPADMEAGAHRVALYVDGELYAWVGLEVVRPTAYSGPEGRGDELAFTGTDDATTVVGAWALTLVILGGALIAAVHLRRARGARL